MKLLALRRIYTHLLRIPCSELPNTPWHLVLRRLEELAAAHPIAAFPKICAEPQEAAMRLMRGENYLIALFNKNLVDLRLPLEKGGIYEKILNQTPLGGQVLTRALEANISWCILGHLLDQEGNVRVTFTRAEDRAQLIQEYE